MAKDRSERKEKKEKKEKRRSDADGVVKKSKKDKKRESLVNGDDEEDVTTKVLESLDDVPADNDQMDIDDSEEKARPLGALVPFANPLADEKVAKKVLKSVKKGMSIFLSPVDFIRPILEFLVANFLIAAVNKSLKRGVKEVVKAVRKSPIPAANAAITTPIGIVVLAADISPMDVISHIPVLCEDHGIPYVYVTSRAELGTAGATKRPTSVVMISPRAGGKNKKDEGEEKEFTKVYEELTKVVQKEQQKVKV